MMSQSHSRPAEIIATALELVETRGVGRLTTAALARRLGFTEAALYRYFSGKSAILVATKRQLAEELFTSMATDLASPAEGGAPVDGRLATHLSRFTAHQGVLLELILTGATSRDGELQEAGSAFLEEYYHRMVAFFGHAVEAGMISRGTSPRELASLWICQLLGGFIHSRLTNEVWNPDRHDGFHGFLARLGAADQR